MRNIILSAICLVALTACDWNTKQDYKPKAEYESFLKKQEEAAKATPAPEEASKP